MKTVRVINTKTSAPVALTVDSGITSWGQLKSVLNDNPSFNGLDFGKCHVYAKDSQSRTSLVLNEAPIPASNFTLFVTPIATKGGVIPSEDELEELRDKLNDLIDDMIGIVNGEEVVTTSTSLTADDEAELRNIRF